MSYKRCNKKEFKLFKTHSQMQLTNSTHSAAICQAQTHRTQTSQDLGICYFAIHKGRMRLSHVVYLV